MKGTFVEYSNSSKAYRIYIKDGNHIEVKRDVIFDESISFKKSKELSIDYDDEEILVFEEEEGSRHEEEGPSEPIQSTVIQETRKRPNCLKSTLIDVEGHGSTQGSHRESKRPKIYVWYVSYMMKLIEAEPSTFEEAIKNQEWKDAMNEEYKSIMKNGV